MEPIRPAAIFKSLADDTRLALVRELTKRGGEVAGSSLITGCGQVLQLSQPTLSHHFARLVQSGVLLDRKSGTEKYYCLNVELLESIGLDVTKV